MHPLSNCCKQYQIFTAGSINLQFKIDKLSMRCIHKSLYGLKQPPGRDSITTNLIDYFLFTYHSHKDCTCILIYIDDIIYSGLGRSHSHYESNYRTHVPFVSV